MSDDPAVNTRSRKNSSTTSGNTPKTATASNCKSSDLSKFMAQVNSALERLSTDLADVKTTISNLETALLAKVDEKLSTLNSKIAQIDTALHSLHSRVEILESGNSTCHHMLARMEHLERQSISGDLILTGVPENKDENLRDIFGRLCSHLNCEEIVPHSVFRVPQKSGLKKGSSIIVKLGSAIEKKFVMKQLFTKLRTNKITTPATSNNSATPNNCLRLRHIGFDSDAVIFLNESLAPADYAIRRAANILKKEGKLAAVFTLNSRVFIKRSMESRPVLMHNLGQLNDPHV